MAYEITEAVQEDRLEIVITGNLGPGDADAISAAVFDLAARHCCRCCLIDVRGFVGRLGVLGAYTTVQDYDPTSRRVKTAVLDQSGNAEYSTFHETVAQNRAFPIRYFTSRDEALKWLSAT